MKFSDEEKDMWVEDWRQSGKSAWTYAKENGLVPQTFAGWTKKETAAKPCFVEIPAGVVQPPRRTQEILIEKGDVKIHIPLELGRGETRAVTEWLGRVL